jgi:hypothetical protein
LYNYQGPGTRANRCSLFVLLFLSIGLIFSRFYAQEFKIIGGGTFSKYSRAPSIGWILGGLGSDIPAEYKPGFAAGIGIEISSAKNLSLEIDGMYFQKGSRFDFSDALYDRKMNFFLNVLSFPVLLKFQILPESSPYLLAGGELSIVLSHKSRAIFQGLKEPTLDEKDKVKALDLALVVGGGIEIPVKPVSIFIEARYHLGIQDISNDRLYFSSLKTSAVAVLLGIKI